MVKKQKRDEIEKVIKKGGKKTEGKEKRMERRKKKGGKGGEIKL